MKNRTNRTHIARRTGSISPDTGIRLPHERDESAEPSGEQKPDMAIAERDVREGRVDTDNYNRLREVGEAGLRKRR